MYDNPYIKYAYKKITTEEFINIATKEFPFSFIKYCEILIHNDGMIELAVPSHQKAMIRISNKSDEDLSIEYFEEELLKYSKCVAVWYDFQKAYKLNRFQLRTLNILSSNKLIIKNINLVDEFIKERMKIDL